MCLDLLKASREDLCELGLRSQHLLLKVLLTSLRRRRARRGGGVVGAFDLRDCGQAAIGGTGRTAAAAAAAAHGDVLQDNGLLMLLDRDTRRGPRTRVLAVITRRSDHCSLLRTHKPGSPLLLCPARTPVPLAQVLTHCSIALFNPASLNPRTRTQYLEIWTPECHL